MPYYDSMTRWPFFPPDTPAQEIDLEKNQALSIILDDDMLRMELIKRFSEGKDKLVQPFASMYHSDDNQRSRPYSHVPPGQHRKNAWIVAGYEEVREVLESPRIFSNVPYAELGDRSFILALDPFKTTDIPDSEHSSQLYIRQHKYMNSLISEPAGSQLSLLANEAVRHAVVAGLTRNRFDLAELAEQATIRFCGLWFGFASTDHGLIQTTAAASYRALVHIIVGKHFDSDPTAIPQARVAMAQLTERASDLIIEYRKVSWQPREVRGNLKHRQQRALWPEGVTPMNEWGLSEIGSPLLQRMALDSHDFTVTELASMATGLIAGTVGNVQASVCAAIQQLFSKNDDKRIPKITTDVLRKAKECPEQVHKGELHDHVGQLLFTHPPVAYLPRRAVKDHCLGNQNIKAGDEILLWLTAASHLKGLKYKKGQYGLPFGAANARINSTEYNKEPATPHACLGKPAAHALTTAIVGTVLRLPSVAEVIDPYTGDADGLTRHLGFSCESYPLTHKRAVRLAQQPLNVIMRVKTPTDLHSTALQHIIHVGAPRVEKVLKESGHVHFAWFQLLEQGRYLALHTVYDGDFDAYIQDFALKIDDLFDLLFEHVEGAPQLPVAENPGSFVDVIRNNNAPSVNGYFFSSSPSVEASDVTGKFSN